MDDKKWDKFEKYINSLSTFTTTEHNQSNINKYILEKYISTSKFLSKINQIKETMVDSDLEFIGYFDGASKSNPGPASCGFLIKNQDRLIIEDYFYLGKNTNNVAEYLGISYLLLYCYLLGIKKVTVFGDSALIINQIKDTWKVKKLHLLPFKDYCKSLMKSFIKCELIHVRRERNKEADKLCNRAFRDKNGLIN